MVRPQKVQALPGYRLAVKFSDGTEGIIDLSREVGIGVFKPLAVQRFFERVYIGEFGQIAWSPEIEICPDAAYEEIKGTLKSEPSHA